MTRYFVDTEFIEDGETIRLISLGIVAEDGRELYLQNGGCPFWLAGAWVQANVYPYLEDFTIDRLRAAAGWRSPVWASPTLIARKVSAFCSPVVWGTPEFWAYYGAYDWVALCQIFGTMMDLPEGWPMFAYDLRQWLNHMGHANVDQPNDMPHHALTDARWIAETYRKYSQ